jgi:hypothetical protein
MNKFDYIFYERFDYTFMNEIVYTFMNEWGARKLRFLASLKIYDQIGSSKTSFPRLIGKIRSNGGLEISFDLISFDYIFKNSL